MEPKSPSPGSAGSKSVTQKPHYNIYLNVALMHRIDQLKAQTHRKSRSTTILWLAKIGLHLPVVSSEWGVGENGEQVPTGVPVGVKHHTRGRRAIFHAPESVFVDLDNFRHDNGLPNLSAALRVLLHAALDYIDVRGCPFCRGEFSEESTTLPLRDPNAR